jgi:hypothetical protein
MKTDVKQTKLTIQHFMKSGQLFTHIYSGNFPDAVRALAEINGSMPIVSRSSNGSDFFNFNLILNLN